VTTQNLQTEAIAAELASQYGLDGRLLKIDPLHIAENATYTVRYGDASVPQCVIRLYRNGRHSTDRIHSELAWVSALAHEGIHTAMPHRTADGALTGAIVMPDGQTVRCALLDYLPPDADLPDLKRTITALGAAAARLQNHARTWEPPRYFDRPSWDITATLTPETPWGRWLTTDLPTDAMQTLRDARGKILDELPDFNPPHTVLQHADLKVGNSIWSGGILHIIDFDDSGFSWPLFDLAASLTGLENIPETAHLVDAWLTGFAQFAQIEDNDLSCIPALLMQRRLMILGWLLAHPDGYPELSRRQVLTDTVEMSNHYLHNALP